MNKINIAAIVCLSSLTYFQASAYGVFFKNNTNAKIKATINLAAHSPVTVYINPGDSKTYNTDIFCIQSINLDATATVRDGVQGTATVNPPTMLGMHCGDVHITINKNQYNNGITAEVN